VIVTEQHQQMIDIYDLYNKMECNNIMLSFKGDITSELMTSILQIMESRLENMGEDPRVKKKVYNVLVECLQNLYHHIDDEPLKHDPLFSGTKSAIFMIGISPSGYTIMTGNYIKREKVSGLEGRLDQINALDPEALKSLYKEVLNNEEISSKGGGGLGMIDIARKTGQKLNYAFSPVNSEYSFFSLNIKVSH
jgi:hypothetical protein